MNIAKKIVVIVLSIKMMGYLLGIYFGLRLRFTFKGQQSGSFERILHLSSFRAPQDVEILKRGGRLAVAEFPVSYMLFVNAILQKYLEFSLDDLDFFYSSQEEKVRKRLSATAYLSFFLKGLILASGAKAFVTPAAHYRQEKLWAFACEDIKVPFVALHKEMVTVPSRHFQQKVNNKKKGKGKWHGSHICVANQMAKDIAVQAGLAPADKISVSGLIRADDLSGPSAQPVPPINHAKPQVTFFSFGHYTGAFLTVKAQRSKYFCADNSDGFVDLFDATHAQAAAFALRHPNVRVMIKPKLYDANWNGEIDRAIKQATGMTSEDIENLSIVDTPALSLIDRSCCVVALNSTVVLEARLRKRPVILPLFAEANGRHQDALFFTSYFDLFSIAKSEEQLASFLDQALKGELELQGEEGRLQALGTRYFGSIKGENVKQVVNVIERAIKG